jgi:hypothetical protein
MCRSNSKYTFVALHASHGEVEFLALDNPGLCQCDVTPQPTWDRSLCIVNVEEVGVQDGLDDTGDDCDRVVEARHIEEVTVDPVGNV